MIKFIARWSMKMNSMSDVAVIVQRERKRQGATQIELSQMANVGVRFLRDVEDGKPSVHFDKLMRILSVLGIAVDFRCMGDDAK